MIAFRYYAIVKEPLLYQVLTDHYILLQLGQVYNHYQNRKTFWRTVVMIFLAWLIGIAIGFTAVFSGIYTTEFANDVHWDNPDRCEFEVRNKMCTIFELF